jgi:hypothetical protein
MVKGTVFNPNEGFESTYGPPVKDITDRNDSMPWFPDEMPWWQRVLCVLGYHRWEPRATPPGHRLGDGTPTIAPIALRDQCGRCGTLR